MSNPKSFFSFLKGNRTALLSVLLLLLGVCFLLLGGSGEAPTQSETTPEQQLAILLARVEGVGECHVQLGYDEQGEVSSVVVVCPGAENTAVRKNLTEMLVALYGIGAHRVSIVKSR